MPNFGDQLDNSVVPRSMRNRNYGGFRVPAPAAPTAPEAPATRSFGFQSGAGPGEKMAAARAPELAGAGAALGEPTSFRGGAGAPPPVEVVRGARTTFTNPAPDSPGGGYNPTAARNTQEFASPLQAGQAYNRGERAGFVATHPTRENLTYPTGTSPEEQATAKYGKFRAPGQTVAEIQATKEGPGTTAARSEQAGLFKAQREGIEAGQAKIDRDRVGTDYDKLMHEVHGDFDTGTGKGVFKAKDEASYKDSLAGRNRAIETGNAKVGQQLYEDRQMARKWLQTQPLPANMDVNAYLDAAASHPESWNKLMEHVNASGLAPGAVPQKHWYNFGGGAAPATSAPAPSAFQAPTPQPFAGAGEQGEAVGAPAGKSIDLGPGWGKPLGGAGFVQ